MVEHVWICTKAIIRVGGGIGIFAACIPLYMLNTEKRAWTTGWFGLKNGSETISGEIKAIATHDHMLFQIF